MIALVAIVAVASASDEGDQLQASKDQARFFLKKQWYGDARDLLEKVVATPDGRVDPEAWMLLATVRFEMLDVEGARDAAERAHSYARDDDQLQAAAQYEQFLTEQFGTVDLQATYSGLVGHVDIELKSVLFDPELKNYLGKITKKYAGKVTLPVKFGLPVGTYDIDGQQVVVEGAKTTMVVLTAGQATGGGAALTQLAKAEVSLGMGVWLGPEVKNLYPALEGEASLTQPIGPVVAGVIFGWSPRAFTTEDGKLASSVDGFSGGVRIGRDLAAAEHLVVRPSLGYRYEYVPGIARGCSGSDAAFSCADPPAPDLVVYSVGRAHVPFAELSVDWIDNTRKSGLGLGVKVTGEHAFGSLPASSEATFGDGSIAYTVDDGSRAWSANGARMLLNLSLAF